MKKIFLGLSLALVLAACSDTANIPVETAPKTPNNQTVNGKSEVTARSLAQTLVDSGVTKEEAESRKADRLKIESISSSAIKQQRLGLSAQDVEYKNRRDELIMEAYDLIINGEVSSDESTSTVPDLDQLQPQNYELYRSTYLQGAENISLYSNSNFRYYQSIKRYEPPLSYVDDGCSSPGGLGFGWDRFFYPACDQHDFGYRNGKKFQEIHTLNFKWAVDDRFLQGMLDLCRANSTDVNTCYDRAGDYHWAVTLQAVDNSWIQYGDNEFGLYFPSYVAGY